MTLLLWPSFLFVLANAFFASLRADLNSPRCTYTVMWYLRFLFLTQKTTRYRRAYYKLIITYVELVVDSRPIHCLAISHSVALTQTPMTPDNYSSPNFAAHESHFRPKLSRLFVSSWLMTTTECFKPCLLCPRTVTILFSNLSTLFKT